MQVLEVRQLVPRVDAEELLASRAEERHVRHSRDARDVAQQLHILRSGAEGVVGNHRADRLSAELAELGGVYVLVKAGLDDLGRVLKVVDEVLLRDVEDLNLRILAEIDVVDEEFQRTPR